MWSWNPLEAGDEPEKVSQFLIIRVELKLSSGRAFGKVFVKFLIIRVELKLEDKSYHGESFSTQVFLIIRVELKRSSSSNLKGFLYVLNHPCGVETPPELLKTGAFQNMFLIIRVELKPKSTNTITDNLL